MNDGRAGRLRLSEKWRYWLHVDFDRRPVPGLMDPGSRLTHCLTAGQSPALRMPDMLGRALPGRSAAASVPEFRIVIGVGCACT